jgi:hypothetical protein
MDAEHQDSGVVALLASIGKDVSDTRTDIAVIKEQLRAVPDHENRIRLLETSKAKMIGAASAVGLLSGGVTTLIYWALQAHH